MLLPDLVFWDDSVVRDGCANMAVDEWLLNHSALPVLRSYRWQPGWGSFGYFVPRKDLPAGPSEWVRRWTGGGIVDHRHDQTYTLVVPRRWPLASAKGAESYRAIHDLVAILASGSGDQASLSEGADMPPGGECFQRPVEYDVIDSSGKKIAGAGQRRTPRGLLHQGSIAASQPLDFTELALKLSGQVRESFFSPPASEVEALICNKYAAPAWAFRR